MAGAFLAPRPPVRRFISSKFTNGHPTLAHAGSAWLHNANKRSAPTTTANKVAVVQNCNQMMRGRCINNGGTAERAQPHQIRDSSHQSINVPALIGLIGDWFPSLQLSPPPHLVPQSERGRRSDGGGRTPTRTLGSAADLSASGSTRNDFGRSARCGSEKRACPACVPEMEDRARFTDWRRAGTLETSATSATAGLKMKDANTRSRVRSSVNLCIRSEAGLDHFRPSGSETTPALV